MAGVTGDSELSVPDPAAVKRTPAEIERSFAQALAVLDRRISLFLCLPLASLEIFAQQREIDNIGKQ